MDKENKNELLTELEEFNQRFKEETYDGENLTGVTDEMIAKHGIGTSKAEKILIEKSNDAFTEAHQSSYNIDILKNDIELPQNINIKGFEKTKTESPQKNSESYKGRKPK